MLSASVLAKRLAPSCGEGVGTCVILALRRHKIKTHLGLYRGFKATLGYIPSTCLRQTNKLTKNKTIKTKIRG